MLPSQIAPIETTLFYLEKNMIFFSIVIFFF